MSRIHAIKYLRGETGWDLHRTKSAVEQVERELEIDATKTLAPDESLRDRFAMAALPAVIAEVAEGRHTVPMGSDPVTHIATSAYELADAMIAARWRAK